MQIISIAYFDFLFLFYFVGNSIGIIQRTWKMCKCLKKGDETYRTIESVTMAHLFAK